ncbi:unnamed protein product, partial [Mesorhabditis belari]|uniref:Exocyst complex component 2 n=1 Tax=Mesorhabditis belari TaxID=2138241 RepID=A0AAF3EDK6_9BILA
MLSPYSSKTTSPMSPGLSVHTALGSVFRAISMTENGPSWGPPVVTGLSPTEGIPGTQITLRGEFLGHDASDLIMLIICGTDCLHSAKWKSPSKIVARVGQASRGLGEIRIGTKSGGRGSSNVKFRVFITQVGPLEESAVWVDETRTVPGREAIRNVAPSIEDRDALGLEKTKKADIGWLANEYPDGSSNLRMESFNPQLYLLEYHMDSSLQCLREGLKNIELDKRSEAKNEEEMHKANLYSLINCVDSLAALHNELESAHKAGEFAVIKQIASQIKEAKSEAESVFREVLTRKDRADATRNALSVLTRFKFIFFLNKSIDENLTKGEFSAILNDYTRAKSLVKDTEVALFREAMAGADKKMAQFKEELKHRLVESTASYEEQSKLIKYLKILDPDSDPWWDCITSCHCWLEEVLWALQETHQKKAVEDAKQTQSGRVLIVEVNHRQVFITEMVSILLSKLQYFWKLASNYTNNDSRSTQRLDDVNQMLINTINVSSWLLLNALVPKSMPDEVLERYKSKFLHWPELTLELERSTLSYSLKHLRGLIASLLETQFTSQHVQPLVELCMTVRLKAISNIVEKGQEAITALAKKENWQHRELVSKGVIKTAIPDLFENEICECISTAREVFSSSGYTGESDLFSREALRKNIIDLLVALISSVRRCFGTMLHLNNAEKRPNDLDIDKKNGKRADPEERGQITTKKILIAICNIEYIANTSLKNISRRMTENGVKYADLIYESAQTKLLAYRQQLIGLYNGIKCSIFQTLVHSINYDYLPDDDVSDFAKEIIMNCVLEQAELEVNAPQLTHECLEHSVQYAFQQLILYLKDNPPRDLDSTTQCVIDISGLEQALSPFLSLGSRASLNQYRAALVGRLDQFKLQRCLTNMRNSMRIAIESLERTARDDLNVSNV